MNQSLKILLSIISLVIVSCGPIQKDEVIYTANIYLYNTSNQTLKIQSEEINNPIYLTKFQYFCLAHTECKDMFSPIENISIENFNLNTYIEVYSVPDNELLKKWTYEERNNDGKQFYRLNDHKCTIEQKDNSTIVNYTFHITDEDLK